MNKDVIYIEPEDDITDIINRLKSSSQKVVALVPPKKLGVLRSAVNNKLIAKAAKDSDKAVVIVTADAALTKMAVTAGLPIAKTLQSRPIMPSETPATAEPKPADDVIEEIDESTADAPAQSAAKAASTKTATKSAKEADLELNSNQVEADKDKAKQNQKKSAKNQPNKPIPVFEKYRKWFIIGGVAGVLLIAFLVWALIFAPAAKVIVAIKTTPNNFSENVTFTTQQSAAKPDEGVFLLEEQKFSQESSVEFTATGQKDLGEKASGTLMVEYRFKDQGNISIAAGTPFVYNGLRYNATNSIVLAWDGEDDEACEGGSSIRNGCRKTGTVYIEAEASGDKYNVSAGQSFTSNTGATATNTTPVSGGTTKMVTVVQQSDIDKAKTELQNQSDNTDLKDKLAKQLPDDVYTIDSSFHTDISDPVSSPAVGEEASSGKAKLTSTATSVIYGVDKSAIQNYIEKKVKDGLADDLRIYSTGDPFFERFLDADGTYTAKLKSTVQTGPKVTEQDILDQAKGKKTGEAQVAIKSLSSGVSDVKIETSYFWVHSVPNDENKITIELTVEEAK